MSCSLVAFGANATRLSSVYTARPDDAEAFYFTPDAYPSIAGNGKVDVSDALQRAIYEVKRTRNFGILFIPEGTYLLSKTIYIPSGIRLIGYGKERPEFRLAAHAPGFDREPSRDKGGARYLFWFVSNMPERDDGSDVHDAGAGTFYSAMSNIDIRIGKGNPYAVALRTHYAQHSFVSYMALHIGDGKAGIFDVGNELENIAFYGGDYGIYTTKSSPGWPVMMVDALFDGQRKAAVRCQESGLAMVNIHVNNVPKAFDMEANYCDKLFVENSYFRNVSEALLTVANENNSNNQLTMRNIYCSKVPVLVHYLRSDTQTKRSDASYLVRSYDHGLQMDSLTDVAAYRTLLDIVPLKKLPAPLVNDLPQLPSMESWVNIRELGARGDNVTDDTQAFQAAIEQYDNIYVPQGWYRITETLKLKPTTRLIGLHPFGTQLCLPEHTAAFSGFGAPKALVESAQGGANVLTGIGINTNAYNYRAVGVKWMSGADSYLNDVKFVGGHGTMHKPQPAASQNVAAANAGNSRARYRDDSQAWDNQHWSLWVTNGGGGTLKDIWTASTYSTSGFYADRTETPTRVYAMSVEHHVRNEVRFNRVSNWRIYCLQTEEESRESSECQPIEMDDCNNMTFANLYMFRVIRVNRPYYSSVRLRNCENIRFHNLHNYAQTKYSNTIAVYDANKNIEVRPWELASLTVTGREASRRETHTADCTRLASDFDFAEGMTADSKGNIYFCDHRMRRVYRLSPTTNDPSSPNYRLSLLADFPWKPSALAVDTQDHLLVLFRYDPQPGWEIDDKPAETLPRMPDAGGTSFSGWGNSGFTMQVYTIDPEKPEESIRLLPRVKMADVTGVKRALYPSNRWRDFHDFNAVTVRVPEYAFAAPDGGATIIPHCYDLARCSSLLPATPGQDFYCMDEYDRRTVRCTVNPDGTLSNLRYFVEDGEFGLTVARTGNVYVTNGNVAVYSPAGQLLRTIETPQRPTSLVIVGDALYATTVSALYRFSLRF
jgi:hypothetical protein